MRRLGSIGLVVVAVAALVWWLSRGSSTEAEDAEGDGAVEVAVHVGQLRRATLRRTVTGYGTVEPEPAGAGHPGAGSLVATPVAGIVAEVLCAEGQRVERGAPLFRLDRRVANVDVEFARLNLERERKLLPIGGTSEMAVQAAERELAAANARRGLLEVDAPLAGVVTRVLARPGESVTESHVLAVLTDPERLVLAAGVPAAELEGLRVGSTALLFQPTGEAVESQVSYVSPDLDPATGTALVRAAVPAGAGVRPGQFMRAQFVVEVRADRLAIPAEGIVESPDGGAAIAVVEGDLAHLVAVERGLRDGDLVEIAGTGLAAGMSVVTEGVYALPDNTRIRVVGP